MNHKTVVFNEAKMNFDGNLDFSVLSSEVVTYSDTTPDQFLERVADAREFDTSKLKRILQSLETGLFFCQIFVFII